MRKEEGHAKSERGVDVGRQLFVDDGFLADRRLSTASVHHHAPTLAQAAPGTIFGGGGVWWDAELGHFKNFFTCEFIHIAGDGALGPLCLSTSTDGEHWENMSGGRPGADIKMPFVRIEPSVSTFSYAVHTRFIRESP